MPAVTPMPWGVDTAGGDAVAAVAAGAGVEIPATAAANALAVDAAIGVALASACVCPVAFALASAVPRAACFSRQARYSRTIKSRLSRSSGVSAPTVNEKMPWLLWMPGVCAPATLTLFRRAATEKSASGRVFEGERRTDSGTGGGEAHGGGMSEPGPKREESFGFFESGANTSRRVLIGVWQAEGTPSEPNEAEDAVGFKATMLIPLWTEMAAPCFRANRSGLLPVGVSSSAEDFRFSEGEEFGDDAAEVPEAEDGRDAAAAAAMAAACIREPCLLIGRAGEEFGTDAGEEGAEPRLAKRPPRSGLDCGEGAELASLLSSVGVVATCLIAARVACCAGSAVTGVGKTSCGRP